MTENQQKLFLLLQKLDNSLAAEFEKFVLANEIGIVDNETLATKTAELSSQAAAILNPIVEEEADPISQITEARILELIDDRVELSGGYPNMIVSIDGSQVAQFDFQQVSEESFINFLNNHGI